MTSGDPELDPALAGSGTGGDADGAAAEHEPADPVGVLALVCGFVGIVVCGIVFAIVTAVVGTIAGQRAREAGRSLETAYLALLLAAVDGVVWIVLHILFDVPLAVG